MKNLVYVALMAVVACGGTETASPNRGHYAGVMYLNNNITCGLDFVIPDQKSYGGDLSIDCIGTASPHYEGKAFVAFKGTNSWLSFDIKNNMNKFFNEDDDCEFVNFDTKREIDYMMGPIDGCGDLIGWYEVFKVDN